MSNGKKRFTEHLEYDYNFQENNSTFFNFANTSKLLLATLPDSEYSKKYNIVHLFPSPKKKKKKKTLIFSGIQNYKI